MRATLIRASATISLLFGALQALCTALDLAAGVGAVQGVLGFIWAGACIVCGLVTIKAPIGGAKSGEAPAQREAKAP